MALVPGDAARAATASVTEVGTAFQPAQVEIVVGDRVVWTNRSNTSHSVAFDNGPDLHPTCTKGLLGPVGDCQEPGAAAQYTFQAAGNFAYRCKLHDAMRGVVVVSPAVASTTSATVPATTATTRVTTTTTRATPSTSSTTRPLATSSTLASSTTTTTTDPNSSVLLPGDPPPFTGEGSSSSASGDAGGDDGGDTATVALIVALLLAVSAGGGYLLWRLRPGRA
ncbi:MAG TPA: plastocyanin/azurin family copper-binding protein [Acidimicrobiia bacterium]|nr:plastocyanin/azurin family copper-binding protein [Acidimicrobiia bacterium]